MSIIIGLAGRKFSGKSELSNVCVNMGFELLPMALPLKELVSNIVGFNINQSQDSKTKIVNLLLNENQKQYISNITNIDLSIVKEKTDKHKFYDIRDMLQFIGTDIIRSYNADWHVNEILKRIKPNHNYVIDDIRFNNEIEMVKKKNGEILFVTRPNINFISNHESETSIKWQQFNYNVIINNKTLSLLKSRFKYYIDYIFFDNNISKPILECTSYSALRNKLCTLLDNNLTPSDISAKYNINVSHIQFLINNLLIPYPYMFYNSKHNFETDFKYGNNKTLKIINNNLTIKENGKRIIIETNPLAIENAKLFIN